MTNSANSTSAPATNMLAKLSSKLFAYIVLAVAVIAMSSGGVWFALLIGTPPILKACWRLTLTSLVQAPFFAYQWIRGTNRARAVWWAELPWLAVSGISLGVHFASWSWSIDHTSLTHSLLFVSTTPLLIVAWMMVRYVVAVRRTARRGAAHVRLHDDSTVLQEDSSTTAVSSRPGTRSGSQRLPSEAASQRLAQWLQGTFDPTVVLPPTALEGSGAVLGFVGSAILIFAAAESKQGNAGAGPTAVEPAVTVEGDAAALLGALSVWAYIEIGSTLRKGEDSMPLFLYATPVTAIGAVSCALFSALLEPSFRANGTGLTSLFGWLGSPTAFGLSLAAAVGSGMLGHTAASFCLRQLNPLIVSVSLLWEPLFGSLLGWIAGVSGLPGLATLLAGPLLLLGALMTTVGARDSGIDWKSWLRRLAGAHMEDGKRRQAEDDSVDTTVIATADGTVH